MLKTILYKKNDGVIVPMYATEQSSGMDVRAFFNDTSVKELRARVKGDTIVDTNDNNEPYIMLAPGDWYLFPTGLYAAIPNGYELQVRPRSGLALKQGVTVLNTPGTIDADYRGEIGVILINHSKVGVIINNNDRIAQLVLASVVQCDEWKAVDVLPDTIRGEGGFNSTGTK